MNIDKEVDAVDRLFNPTKDMTNLDAYIYKCEEIIEFFYMQDEGSEELQDPFYAVSNSEENCIEATGYNYAGRRITTN